MASGRVMHAMSKEWDREENLFSLGGVHTLFQYPTATLVRARFKNPI